MARTRKGDKVDGWVILDKPLGLSSTSALARVRRIFNAAKGGHGGTLDPLATGILPIALGEATKTVSYVQDGAKRYRFTASWGEARATDDCEGEVTATSPVRPTRAAIEAALPTFTGVISQAPPAYSAIKLGGQPAYKRARAGETVAPAARQVRIDAIALDDQPDENNAIFTVTCGKGTYIRSLARDLALALGTVAHVAALRRLAVGPWSEENAITLEKLASLEDSPARFSYLQAVETALDDIPALAVTEVEALRLRQGQTVRIGRTAHQQGPGSDRIVVLATDRGRPVALAAVEPQAAGDALLRSVRVLNL